MTNTATGDIVPAADITPKALQTPRTAGLAGVAFAVLFGVIVVLLRTVVPADPHAAGAWLANASDRRDVQFALGLVPFCGIFFLWFMGAVRARIGESEDKFLATVFLGSGVLFIAMLFVLAAIFGALLGVAGLHNGNPPLDAWQLGRRKRRSILPPSTPFEIGSRLHDHVVDHCLPVADPQPGGGGRWLGSGPPAALREPVDSVARAGLPVLGAPGEHQHRDLVVPQCRVTRRTAYRH